MNFLLSNYWIENDDKEAVSTVGIRNSHIVPYWENIMLWDAIFV